MIPTDLLANSLRDLNVDQTIIDNVCHQLHAVGQTLETNGFRDDAKISDSSFGGSAEGKELAHHHDLAQQIISDTIVGLVTDLTTFRSGVVKAAQVIRDSDDDAATEMRSTQEAITLLDQGAANGTADAAYRNSQKANLPASTGVNP